MSGKATSELANIKDELQDILNELARCEANVRASSTGVSESRCADSIHSTKNYISDIKRRVSSLSAIAAQMDADAEEKARWIENGKGGSSGNGCGGGGGGGSAF